MTERLPSFSERAQPAPAHRTHEGDEHVPTDADHHRAAHGHRFRHGCRPPGRGEGRHLDHDRPRGPGTRPTAHRVRPGRATRPHPHRARQGGSGAAGRAGGDRTAARRTGLPRGTAPQRPRRGDRGGRRPAGGGEGPFHPAGEAGAGRSGGVPPEPLPRRGLALSRRRATAVRRRREERGAADRAYAGGAARPAGLRDRSAAPQLAQQAPGFPAPGGRGPLGPCGRGRVVPRPAACGAGGAGPLRAVPRQRVPPPSARRREPRLARGTDRGGPHDRARPGRDRLATGRPGPAGGRGPGSPSGAPAVRVPAVSLAPDGVRVRATHVASAGARAPARAAGRTGPPGHPGRRRPRQTPRPARPLASSNRPERGAPVWWAGPGWCPQVGRA